MNHNWPWVALAVLGAYHGLNPAMGWLFALALGLQEKRRSAVVGALLPIALGHAAAIAVAILLLRSFQHIVTVNTLKWGVASILFVLGVYRLFRARHPRGPGMRAGGKRPVRLVFPHGIRPRRRLDAAARSHGATNAWDDAHDGGNDCGAFVVKPIRGWIGRPDTHCKHVGRGWNPCLLIL